MYFNKDYKNLFFILINTFMKKDDLLENSSLSNECLFTDMILFNRQDFTGVQSLYMIATRQRKIL